MHMSALLPPVNRAGAQFGGFMYFGVTHARTLFYVEQRMLAVGQVKHPQHRHFDRLCVLPATQAAVQAAASQLRLALRVRVEIGTVLFQQLPPRAGRWQRGADNSGRTRSRLSAEV